jgi:uncharacterized protein
LKGRVVAGRWGWRFITPVLAAAVALGPFLYGFWYEPAGLRVVTHTVRLSAADKISTNLLRIAIIADLHAGAPYIDNSKVERVVALANAAKPDLILLTGDYITKGVIGGRLLPFDTIAARLGNLSAPLGVYAVFGNHEWFYDTKLFMRAFERAGIPVLDDRNRKLTRNGEDIYLVGISDLREGPHDIGKALSGVPKDAHALCFTHAPGIFPQLPATCALTVAGHTHGGQVNLPLINRPIVPGPNRFAAGLVEENGKTLFVSTGIGTSIIPVRIGVPPEVSILDVE